jgi:hypothetical protein
MGLQYRYPEAAIDARRFDAVEVSPVRDQEGITEPCGADEAQAWSVYLHYDPKHPRNAGFGGVLCVSDWDTREEAVAEGKRWLTILRKTNGGITVNEVQEITFGRAS